MQHVQSNRRWDASLAVVGVALVGTVALGALVRQNEAKEEGPPIPDRHLFEFKLKVLERGTGIAPVPTAPPAAVWHEFELSAGGTPVFHRPVQFRREAFDAKGKPLVAEHRWSEGRYYTFIRSGFKSIANPVTLKLTFKGQLVDTLQIPDVEEPTRVLPTKSTPIKWPGLKCEVVRLKGREEGALGLRLDAPLKPGEAVMVTRLGSSFLSEEPYLDPTILRAGTTYKSPVMRLPIGYPEDVDAIKVSVQKLVAVRTTQTLEFTARFQGRDSYGNRYSMAPGRNDFLGGTAMSMGRLDRVALVPDDGKSPMRMYLLARAVTSEAKVKLLSPRRVNGAPIEVNSRLFAAERSVSVDASQAQGDVRISTLGGEIPIRVEVDAWEYRPAKSEEFVVAFDSKRLPYVQPSSDRPLLYVVR